VLSNLDIAATEKRLVAAYDERVAPYRRWIDLDPAASSQYLLKALELALLDVASDVEALVTARHAEALNGLLRHSWF
jgi:hypothetical protein